MASRASAQPLAQSVFERLKRDIVECRLVPEQIVAETPLAARFKVSKGPVREALKRLEQIGFVRAVPRVGYVINGVRVADIDDIFAMRIALEPLAVRLAMARLGEGDLDRLAELAAGEPAAHQEPVETRGRKLARANSAFHAELARLSDNPRLRRTIDGLIEELERVTYLLAMNLDGVRDEHPELVEAMRSGDADRAAETMRAHLEYDHATMRAAAIGAGTRTELSLSGPPS
jgi:DNA-binding GntR family transcriptional regulator